MKRLFLGVLSLCLTVCLFGCGEKTAEPSQAEYDYQDLVSAPLDGKLSDYITEQDLEEVFSQPFSLQESYNEDTQEVFLSQDESVKVSVNMQNMTEETYDDMLSSLEGIKEDVPDVGTKGVWYNNFEMLFFKNGIGAEVIVTVPGDSVPREETESVAKIIAERIR